MALALPGLRQDGRSTSWTRVPRAGIDGVSELWFDTREDFDAAYATEHGKAVAADSMAHVAVPRPLLRHRARLTTRRRADRAPARHRLASPAYR